MIPLQKNQVTHQLIVKTNKPLERSATKVHQHHQNHHARKFEVRSMDHHCHHITWILQRNTKHHRQTPYTLYRSGGTTTTTATQPIMKTITRAGTNSSLDWKKRANTHHPGSNLHEEHHNPIRTPSMTATKDAIQWENKTILERKRYTT